MKTLNKIIMAVGVASMGLGFSSCVDDLNLQPTNPNEITDVSKDMDRVFADVLFNFATYGANGDTPVKDFDGGMATFQRAIYIAEEMPTDEACWLWDPGDYGTINQGKITPDLNCAYGFYSRLMVNVALCNQFIQSAESGVFAGVDTSDPNSAVSDYIRQCKILRSACFYYLMSLYNNPPYADETTPIGAEPSQPGRAQVYENVTACLEEIVAWYKANPRPTTYGFVGLDAAESILAKIYLNGEVFANRADYDKCYQHSKAVIDRLGIGGYYGNGLARSYQALFGYNNDQYSVGHSGNAVNEIIWTIPQSRTNDTQDLTSYAGATFLIAAWIGTNGVEPTVPYPTMDAKYKDVTDANDLLFMETDKDGNETPRVYKYCATQEEYDQVLDTYKNTEDAWKKEVSEVQVKNAYSFDPKATGYVSQQWYNSGDGWKCMVARKAFVKKFEWDDVEMSKSNDRRVAQWQTSAHGFTANNPSLVGDDWGKNGYLAAKYTNWAYNEDGTINYIASPQPLSPVGGDYAAIRLAEVYLMAAEAILQGGGGSNAEALKYVNYIRQRAYGDDPTTTEDDVWKWTSLSINDLRNERCRELYSENVRRTDLIRWNLWCTGYTWEWKGGVPDGTNLPEYTKSYPIPSRVMTSSSLKQIEGY